MNDLVPRQPGDEVKPLARNEARELVDAIKRNLRVRHLAAVSINRVPKDGIHGLEHARIDRDEREALGLHFKDGEAGTDAELLAQAGCFLDIAFNAVLG